MLAREHLLAAGVAAASLLLVSALLGSRAARRLLRDLVGAGVGGLAGLLTFVVGSLAADGEALMAADAPALALAILRSGTKLEAGCLLVGMVVGVVVSRHSWRAVGAASYVSLALVVAGYALHVVLFALPSLPARTLPLALLLFALELASLLMVLAQAFYALDVSARKRWRRRPTRVPFSSYYTPKVAVHVAAYNEPFDLVRGTLESVLALDYPKEQLVVMVLDDSTDPAAVERLARWCGEHGVVHLHREDRRGYKAGALNEALARTPPDAELVAVLDADYRVRPEFLRETVGYFIDPKLGFVQTPQDYRNADDSFLARQYYVADAYFYRAILPSRNEENAIIFCGTMGVLRKAAIEDAGGWGERFLTEDAELSVRILETGYDSLYLDRTYGHGIVPATFDAYQRQHHRWAYGSVQVVKGHLRRLLLGRLTVRQRIDFLVGGLHWLDGAVVFALAAVLLAMGVAELAGAPLASHHAQEMWLLALVPVFLLFDGVARVHLALRRALRLPLSATLGVMGMWMSVKFSNARGALAALAGRPLAFARTPKDAQGRSGRAEALRRAWRLARLETCMMLALASVSLALGVPEARAAWAGGDVVLPRLLLATWLAYYALVFACAPLYAYKSYTTLRPAPDAPPAPEPAPPAEAGPA